MLSSLVLSEPMFAALLFPVVIGAERLVRDDNNTRHIVLVAIGLGILRSFERTRSRSRLLFSLCWLCVAAGERQCYVR